VVLIFFIIAVLLAFGFMGWTWKNRDKRVVKASQPFFLHLICFGCIVLATSIVAHQFDPAISSIHGCSIGCTSTIWLVALGFAIIFSSLFAKTRRINVIMNGAAHFKRVKLTVRDTMKPVAVLLSRKL
jgi:hypothetical protein